MTTEREALDRIAALCDEERWPNSPLAADVRAILAEVTPAPGCTLDRDKARETLSVLLAGRTIPDAVLDLLEACVRPVASCDDAIDAAYQRGVTAGREATW